jgi:diguanylate cyclase (GGDEF)-like protein
LTIRFKLTLLITLLFLAAIVNTLFVFQLEADGEGKIQWVNHTNEVLIESKHLLAYLTDAETGQRGFLLTDDATYLEPYHNGVLEAKDSLSSLKFLTSDNPSQVDLLKAISENIQLKTDELEQTIELRRQDNLDAALEIVSDGKGKYYMDEIREDLTAFINVEHILLEKRKVSYIEYTAQIKTLIAVELVFFIGLAFFTYFFLQKNLFIPLNLLLASARKVESGEPITAKDILARDEMSHLLSTFFSMSEKVFSREKKLDYQANHDELTGLKNRTSLYEDIEESIGKADVSNNKVGILYIDLDQFKEINDTLGHDAGDAILKETAGRLNASVRSSDSVYRIGGDEFLVLLREVGTIENVKRVIDKIVDAMKSPISFSGTELNTSLSIGAAIAPDDACSSSNIVKYADVAMYFSKKNAEEAHAMFDKSMLKRESDK